jgi:hypothetical protein
MVLAGILLPLSLEWRPRLLGRLSLQAGAVLVLPGGFLLRIVVMFSSEGVYTRWHGAGTAVLLMFLVRLGACTSQEASRTRGGGLGAIWKTVT